MNRRDLMLAILAAADGQPYTPVQLQKAAFLISRNLPDLITDGSPFLFTPYDYGPFDRAVYSEAESLQLQGLATVTPTSSRFRTYAANAQGVENGRRILDEIPKPQRDYIKNVSNWVRTLDFATLVKSIYQAYPEMKANSIFKD